jgi:hypothetical protein
VAASQTRTPHSVRLGSQGYSTISNYKFRSGPRQPRLNRTCPPWWTTKSPSDARTVGERCGAHPPTDPAAGSRDGQHEIVVSNTSNFAITLAGTKGRPRPDLDRSATSRQGTTACCAQPECRAPCPPVPDVRPNAPASSNSWLGTDWPEHARRSFYSDPKREPSHLELLRNLLAGGGQAPLPASPRRGHCCFETVGPAQPALVRYRVMHDQRDEHQ